MCVVACACARVYRMYAQRVEEVKGPYSFEIGPLTKWELGWWPESPSDSVSTPHKAGVPGNTYSRLQPFPWTLETPICSTSDPRC